MSINFYEVLSNFSISFQFPLPIIGFGHGILYCLEWWPVLNNGMAGLEQWHGLVLNNGKGKMLSTRLFY